MADDIEYILQLLCSHTKLERDRALTSLELKLKDPNEFSGNEEKLLALQKSLVSFAESTDCSWEKRVGPLLGAKLVILNGLGSESFHESIRDSALHLMHDDEARVRLASGKWYVLYVRVILCNVIRRPWPRKRLLARFLT